MKQDEKVVKYDYDLDAYVTEQCIECHTDLIFDFDAGADHVQELCLNCGWSSGYARCTPWAAE